MALPVVTRRAVNVSAYKYETKNLVAVNLYIHKFYCQGCWSEKLKKKILDIFTMYYYIIKVEISHLFQYFVSF